MRCVIRRLLVWTDSQTERSSSFTPLAVVQNGPSSTKYTFPFMKTGRAPNTNHNRLQSESESVPETQQSSNPADYSSKYKLHRLNRQYSAKSMWTPQHYCPVKVLQFWDGLSVTHACEQSANDRYDQRPLRKRGTATDEKRRLARKRRRALNRSTRTLTWQHLTEPGDITSSKDGHRTASKGFLCKKCSGW